MNSGFYDTITARFADWNYCHPLYLYAFIRSHKPQTVVECGLYRGFAACWMARALQENNTGKLITIDNFSLKEHVERYGDPRTHAEGNLKALGIDQWVEIREGETSDESLWPDKVDIAYLDAWHSHNAVAKEFALAEARGAYLIALDDTENCVGPRLFVEENRKAYTKNGWDVVDIHSDNGLTIFLKRQPRRPITFSQELPLPNPGVDLRPLSLAEQKAHFEEAEKVTGLRYSSLYDQTQHDMPL